MNLRFVLAALLVTSSACSSGASASSVERGEPTPPPTVEPLPAEPTTAPFAGSLQTYDLSVLYPLPSGAAELSRPSLEGARGELVPKQVYVDARLEPEEGEGAPGGATSPKWQDLRLVALRVDPCFAQPLPPPVEGTCENQLRLVFQAFNTTFGGLDSGLHAFYRLGRGEIVDFVRKLATLRTAQATAEENETRAPLAVHPILARQGLDGAMAKGLTDLILAYAGQSNLVRMTRFASSGPVWQFDGVDITSPGATPTPTRVFGLLEANATMTTFSSDGPTKEGTLAAAEPHNDLSLLFRPSLRATATAAEKQAAYDVALRVQNPDLASVESVDCATCHIAFGLQKHVGEGQLGLAPVGNPNLFLRPSSVAESQAAVVADGFDGGLPFNVHMFSYARTTPTVNARVVNETLSVLAYLTPVIRGE